MRAVIMSGGKQLSVEEGDSIEVELLKGDTGAEVEFSNVLLLCDGDKTIIGEPSINGCVVKGKLEGTTKGPKVDAMKYKPRSSSQRKRWGHRQKYSKVTITKISHKS